MTNDLGHGCPEGARGGGIARDFLRSCSSTPASAANVALVQSLSALLARSLAAGESAALRATLSRARERRADADDLIAAAVQCVMDECDAPTLDARHATFKRLVSLCRRTP
ncbi:hypothetical protein WPS_26000 [Vulcanimicrobium alpinum]|uniref:Uncharacterized protein n=1 Tax=Vulcanimicrobium alpinum TaxID=3016050 RepID=A0AAN1XXS7_UNVUL|nr:hypothetical protein [Vulcanimicrobium alpinum]BDE07324.1 hypothetical protein WPS_26000 [Vulcanimicrobium alpinum]